MATLAHRWSLALAGLAFTVGACGDGAPVERVDGTEAPLSANDKTAFDFFLGKGLTNFQAAGIVGNLDQESGMDPTISQIGGGPGRGIAQWSAGGRWDTDAKDNAVWYAGQQGQDVWSLQLQLEFIWYELTTFSSYGLSALKQSTDVSGATIAFQNDFEGCGACDQSQRIAYAQAALNAYGNDVVDGGGGGPAPDAGGGTPCTVPGVGAGECISTTECAAKAGHVSTPGYCPGPADIECCTGPSNDAGTASGGDAASPGQGDAGVKHGDGGAPVQGDAGGSPPVGQGDGGGAPESDASAGAPANASAWGPSGSAGCSTSGGARSGSPAYWLAGLAWVVARRRKKPGTRPSVIMCKEPWATIKPTPGRFSTPGPLDS